MIQFIKHSMRIWAFLKGDSGGPTICNDVHGEPRLYGVTSFASGQLEGAKWRCHGEVYFEEFLNCWKAM